MGSGEKWPMKVLLVEDERVNRIIMVNILNRFVETVREAGDGQEALEMLKTFPADLVVTDLSMPRMDGLTLLAELKKQNNPVRSLVLTAHNETGILEKADDLKTYRCLFKPLRVNLLAEALGEVAAELGLQKLT